MSKRRTDEERKMDELYESILMHVEEAGVKLEQLRIMTRKLGAPIRVLAPVQEIAHKDLLPDIRRVICDVFSQPVDEVCGPRRYGNLVEVRAAITLFIVRTYGVRVTLKEIGQLLGGRDHSTIVNIRQVAEDLQETDEDFKRKYWQANKAGLAVINNNK